MADAHLLCGSGDEIPGDRHHLVAVPHYPQFLVSPRISAHIVDMFPNLPSMKREHIYFVLQLQPCFLIGGDANQMVARRIVAMVTDPTETGGRGGYTFVIFY